MMPYDNTVDRIIEEKLKHLEDIDKSIALLRDIVTVPTPNYDDLRKAYHQLILARAVLDTNVRTEAYQIGYDIAKG